MAGLHSTFGPSSSKRIMLCPASYTYHDNSGTSSYAIEGTAAHEVHEQILLHPEVSPRKYIGQIITVQEKDGDHEVEVTKEMLEAVMESIDRIKDITNEIEAFGEEPIAFVEVRVNISFWTPIPNQFGTSDYCLLSVQQKHLTVIDYKHGAGVVVYAKENPQLALYGLGQIQELMWGSNHKYDIETVSLIIHQPNANNFDRWDLTYAELLEFGGYIKKQLKEALLDNARFGPSGEACQFCSYKPRCPALAAKVAASYAGHFGNLDVVPVSEIDLSLTLPMQVKEVTDESIGRAWMDRGLIKLWLDSVKTECEARIMQGHKVPGLKLVVGRNSYDWFDKKHAAKELVKILPKDEVFDVSINSPSVIRKKLPKAVRESVELLIRKKAGRPTVTLESDKREEYVMHSEHFSDLDVETDLSDYGL